MSSALVTQAVIAQQDNTPPASTEQRDVARQYAQLVGRLALTDKLFAAMSARCDAQLIMPSEALSAIDYALRQQTGYSFAAWQQSFSDAKHESRMVNKLIDSTLTDIGGCDTDAVEAWYNGMRQNLLQPGIQKLASLPRLWGLPPEAPSKPQLSVIFRQKLQHYKSLSIAEVRGLARALSSGIYTYSIVAFAHPVSQDPKQAVALREFVYDRAPTAEHLYELANSVQAIDKPRALALFKQAAEQGDFFAQRWWGNYQGCTGHTDKALHWLTLAKRTRPDEASFIDDIIAEINLLGEPTNCIDGWVH
ncbi:hypothetical protein [Alteromonas gilva]|uniref:Sel1 repeat family protein n=1 Tax=Alteromonas gilva TaxID=2987522 RepID=A0ABT5KXP8_9ALTE|nr:hypothetical protein [Alteromonas gilva]MDC8829542.1 hypothetical protein [Alteromonas gilva]